MIRISAGLCIGLAALGLLSLTSGEYRISPDDILTVLAGAPEALPTGVEMILFDFRMPRLILAALVGAALAVAGTVAQAILRNPLAEPGILGINAGAALAVMALAAFVENASVSLQPLAGFLGALAMAAAIFGIAWKDGTTSLRIILIGVGLNALAGAGSACLANFGNADDVQRAMIWMAGSLHHAHWEDVRRLTFWLAVPCLVIMLVWRELDLTRFGDLVARGLGQPVDPMRALMILLCTLVSGAAVAAAGLIGFVGLVAPHVARRLIGPGHARLLPISALMGAVLVVAADLVGRVMLAPAELPVGIVTALVGVPFFAYLLWSWRDA
ncbi:iron ABC transporter permease [Nisaea sp.]|uniref:FecCD family ABC transporter permease n=1 Tax=Nisaea sp. TaxID=2024842 RepID=UPI003265449D